jgi:hypothetical protein
VSLGFGVQADLCFSNEHVDGKIGAFKPFSSNFLLSTSSYAYAPDSCDSI